MSRKPYVSPVQALLRIRWTVLSCVLLNLSTLIFLFCRLWCSGRPIMDQKLFMMGWLKTVSAFEWSGRNASWSRWDRHGTFQSWFWAWHNRAKSQFKPILFSSDHRPRGRKGIYWGYKSCGNERSHRFTRHAYIHDEHWRGFKPSLAFFPKWVFSKGMKPCAGACQPFENGLDQWNSPFQIYLTWMPLVCK